MNTWSHDFHTNDVQHVGNGDVEKFNLSEWLLYIKSSFNNTNSLLGYKLMFVREKRQLIIDWLMLTDVVINKVTSYC